MKLQEKNDSQIVISPKSEMKNSNAMKKILTREEYSKLINNSDSYLREKRKRK